MTEPRLRVAQILYSGLGGHGGVAFGLIDGDRDRQWDWTLGFLGIEPLLPAYADQCARRNLPCRYLPAIAGAPWKGWPGILRWLQETRPDAIVLHSPSAVLPCAFYARRASVPLLVVEHQQNSLKRRGEWLASRACMRLADRVVVLTDDYARRLAEGLGRAYRPEKVRVIPNGLDLQRFRPSPARSGGRIRVGMAARFTAIKRFDLLVGAMAELKRQHPQQAFELSLAGHGETLDAVRAQAAAAGVGDRIAFEGMLDDDAFAEWMRGIDIYAHASAGETLSLALLQAMATAKPIVASDVAGIDTLLGPLRSSAVRLVGEPAPEAFAAALLDIASDLDAAQRAAQRLRAECEGRFSIGRTFERYREAVESARADRARAGRRGISAGSGGLGKGGL